MTNTRFEIHGDTGIGILPDGTEFLFDADVIHQIQETKWYRTYKDPAKLRQTYIIDQNGHKIHEYLFEHHDGLEIDHINGNTLDNRSRNLRVCTHQQNQCNQPLQKNNSSGVTGVSYYRPRRKYRARIKVCQHDIHLGYYDTFLEAVQARNFGMKCLFGEYGRYNDVPEAANWVKQNVYDKCRRFSDLAVGGILARPVQMVS